MVHANLTSNRLKILCSILAFFIMLLSMSRISLAQNNLPPNLTDFSSNEGIKLLENNITPNTLKLLLHFTTQKNLTYCGIASAVMILNASSIEPINDNQHPSYKYYNQDNFFTAKVKAITTPEIVNKRGITMGELSKALEAHGLVAVPYYSNLITIDDFRTIIKSAIKSNDFIIVNFLRSKINQNGGLHHSPIAAYDANTDQVLILDVSRYKYTSYWVKITELWNSVNVFVNNNWHGMIVIKNSGPSRS